MQAPERANEATVVAEFSDTPSDWEKEAIEAGVVVEEPAFPPRDQEETSLAIPGEVVPEHAEEAQPPIPQPAQANSLEDLMRFCEVAAASGLYPGQNPMKLLMKAMRGKALGLDNATAFNEIVAIGTSTTISAEMQRALAQRAGYEIVKIQSTAQMCELALVKDGVTIGTCSFTIDEAIKAGLMRSSAWQSWPTDMLFARCSTRLITQFCPWILFWTEL